MEKGQIVELTIEDMSGEGQGIGKTDEGFVVFVPDAVVGDRVRTSLTKVKKNYAFSNLEEVVEESPFRNEEFDCRICGGCPLGVLQYEKQLEIKEKQVRSKLEHLAGFVFAETDGPLFRPIIGMSEDDNDGDGPFRYRNKAVMTISHNKRETLIGFNKAKSNDVIDCSDCYLQPLTVAAAVMATKEFILQTKGWFTGMTVKTAFGTGQVMVVYDIVDKGAVERMMPQADLLIDLLDETIYNLGSYDDGEPAFTLESVALRWEKKSDKGYHGPKRYDSMTLAGSNTIVDEIALPGEARIMQFEISPESFYQVNTAQMQRLYGVVREYCKKATDATETKEAIDSKPLILDLYCGVGTIGLCVADLAEKVVGIEMVRDAVVDANRNAVINGIVNAFYVCGKAEEEIGHVLEEAGDLTGRETIAILDPPRAGCRPELLEAVAKAGIVNIIYVSCDPATLGRDLKLLLDRGYKLVEATPVDMFPHTGHVECVVLMSRV